MTRDERIQNNFLWDAQEHNSSVVFVHLRRKHQYSKDRRILAKQKTLDEYMLEMAQTLKSFDESNMWKPYKERFEIQIKTLTIRDYFVFRINANFTLPDDEFITKYSKELPFNQTDVSTYYE
jgi:hypothetical protein